MQEYEMDRPQGFMDSIMNFIQSHYILVICLILLIAFIVWIVHALSKIPLSVEDKYKSHCAELTKLFDEMGLPEDSPMREKHCGPVERCPSNLDQILRRILRVPRDESSRVSGAEIRVVCI